MPIDNSIANILSIILVFNGKITENIIGKVHATRGYCSVGRNKPLLAKRMAIMAA
jgi:hypothetical protein